MQIDNSALITDDLGQTGVYVRIRDTVVFTSVEVLYSHEDISLVSDLKLQIWS